MDNQKPLHIAIDGPVGSGKGTLAVALAKKLNAMHIYTGGMYRSLALACLRNKVDVKNEEAVMNVLRNSNIELRIENDSPLTKVFLNGKDVTNDIFFPEVSNITPIVSAYKGVREEMVKKQRALAQNRNGVVEGRDVTTKVLPNADLKVFLTATVDERARRRFEQLRDKNVDISLEDVKKDIVNRDTADSTRDVSPLTAATDALVIDTTNDTVDDTIKKVTEELTRRNLL